MKMSNEQFEWNLIDNSKEKDKQWIHKEYNNLNVNGEDQTILIYEEDEDKKDMYGNWRTWIGKRDGSNKGVYSSHETQEEAINHAQNYMKITTLKIWLAKLHIADEALETGTFPNAMELKELYDESVLPAMKAIDDAMGQLNSIYVELGGK